MTFLRLTPGHLIAMVAALALLLFMALDWYSTAEGESLRRDESLLGEDQAEPGTLQLEAQQDLQAEASIQAEEEEQNAWTATDALDRIILVLLIASIVLALAAAVLRAAGRRSSSSLTPSLVAAGTAALAMLLVIVRIIDVGAAEPGGAVEAGAPLGLLAVGMVAFGSVLAFRAERAPAPEAEASKTAA